MRAFALLPVAALAVSAFAVACGSSESSPNNPPVDSGTPVDGSVTPDATGPESGDDAPAPLAKFTSTVDKTYASTKPKLTEEEAGKHGNGPARDPAVLAEFEKLGYGVTEDKPGEPHTSQTAPGVTAGTNGTKLLARFAHLTDFQMGDDEAPTRLGALDAPNELFAYAARAQEAELCVLVDAAIRTMNRVHGQAPLDAMILGGDNIENALQNELDWLLQIMHGEKGIKCDSGAPNDPVPGPNNDGKDTFDAEGSKVKWYWAMGNHDILFNGNEPTEDATGKLLDEKVKESLGTSSKTGTRDYSKPGAPIVTGGGLVADPKRMPMTRKDVLKRVFDKKGGVGPEGHGIDAAQLASGKSIYAIDLRDKVRVVVFDTPVETGSAGGVVRRGDLDKLIKPLLDKAKADGKWTMVLSHHCLPEIGDGGGAFGTVQPDAVPADELKNFFAGYSNLIAHVCGHEHANRVVFRAGGARGYWEIASPAIADWPQQFRVLEVFEEAGGLVRIRSTMVDIEGTGEAFKRGRRLSVLDWASGWGGGSVAMGAAKDRNVDLWIK